MVAGLPEAVLVPSTTSYHYEEHLLPYKLRSVNMAVEFERVVAYVVLIVPMSRWSILSAAEESVMCSSARILSSSKYLAPQSKLEY